jgi:UDP:flavonoid glycosyltransferase YjiC (YdhE family)
MSTVATTLAGGLPMVCLPQGRDQPLNAARVEELGAGLMLDQDAVPDELAAAVRAVLGDRRYRIAAQGLAANAQAVGHGELATDLVDVLARAVASRR